MNPNNCPNYSECVLGYHRYGKGCFTDDFNNAMGGTAWVDCFCGVDNDGKYEECEEDDD